MRNVAISFLFLGFIGCGGGGGSGDGGDEPFYAGRWRGSASLVINTCPRGLDIPPRVSAASSPKYVSFARFAVLQTGRSYRTSRPSHVASFAARR